MKTMRAHVIRSPKPSIRWALELLWALSVHRIALRYKETVFGFGWIFLQPVALTIIFTYIFQRFAQVPSEGVPYPLFSATGLVAWSFTALVMSQSMSSISGYATTLKRVALPKIVLPLSIVVSTLADLCVMATLLIGLFVYYQHSLTPGAMWTIVVFVTHVALMVGLSCTNGLLNVFIRDAGHAIPSLLQLWFFASPVFYPVSLVPAQFQMIARWNPMTGVIEGYRSSLLFGQPPAWEYFGPTLAVTAVVVTIGVIGFRRLEGTVADLI